MLVLSRKRGEKVIIGGDITLTVVEVKGNRVRLAVEAPDQIRILRAELGSWHDDPLDPDLEGKPDWSAADDIDSSSDLPAASGGMPSSKPD
jgi:carbon storage regulator